MRQSLSQLTKLPIAVGSTLSAATGYVLVRHSFDPGLATVSAGVLMVGMGACAINEAQDCGIDAIMERTRHRPIPTGVISPVQALGIAGMLVIGGLLILWRLHNAEAAVTALIAVAWYNGIYTYLKRVSVFAVLPGALVGALPPLIGWTAAGGSPFEPRVLALCFFFFMWQVPHFWLLLFSSSTDYRKAGLPSIAELFGRRQLASLAFIWMLATSVSSFLLPVYQLTSARWVSVALIAGASWLAWTAFKLLYKSAPFRPAFRNINLYALCVMALVITDAIF